MKLKSAIAFSLIVGVGLTTFLLGCHKDPVCTVTVEGIVTDSLTGEPVSGVEVILLSDESRIPPLKSVQTLGHDTTDLNGHYSLKNTVDCSDNPVIFHTGSQKYEILTGYRKVEKNKNNEIDFKLQLRY